MKTNNFKHTMLTVGVIAALGTTGTIANAAESAQVSAKNGSTISNTATATYKVDNVVQPTVTSNTVTVNINEIGSFTLIAPQGDSTIANKDDVNEAQPIAPGGSVNFKNILKNTGNVDDTYTITLSDVPLNLITASDDFRYKNIADTVIHVVVKDDQGNPVDPSNNAFPTELKSGETIKLPPKYSAELSYNVTPEGDPNAGESGIMQISATSTYITDNGTTNAATLSNEDQGIVTKPIFGIIKTVNNTTNTTIDLNKKDTIDYKITVTNLPKPYSADATNIGIEDSIPDFLNLDTTSIKVSESDGTPVSGAITSESTTDTLKVSRINLAKGESVVITFTVNIANKAELAKKKTVVNNATVYDKFGSNDTDPFTDPDIKDSTDETTDATTTGTTNDDDDNTDSPSTVNFTNRGIELKDNNTKEIPQNGSVEVTHTLTNTGNDAEGDKAGELIVTVEDTTPTDKVKPTGDITVIIYNKDGTKAGEKEIPVNSSGPTKIDIHDVLDTGIPAGGKAEIKYTETSPAENANGEGAPIDTTDTTKVTAELKDPTATNPDASIVTQENTDTFTVGTLKLVKTQLLDENCSANTTSATTASNSKFNTDTVNAKPGQCVIYRITATNGFTTKALTDITISDDKSKWESAATYVANSANVFGVSAPETAPVTEPSASNPAVSTTISKIAESQSASLLFKVKIKTDVNP